MKEKIKSICRDSTWSIAGIVLMNIVAQFVVYPVWNQELGPEDYGNILFLVALTNIIASPMGSACNYVRIARSAVRRTDNSGYLYILTLSSLILAPVTVLFGILGRTLTTPADILLYALLMVVTVWLNYVDVEYRLTLHYVRYFFYCVVISLGYLAGTLLFTYFHIWTIPLLVGSFAGVIVVFCRGSIFKLTGKRNNEEKIQEIWKPVAAMYVTTALSNLIFCADRIVLKYLVNSVAVTTYYLASMLGKTLSLITGPLSSVVIGYLAKYKGKLSVTWMNRLAVVCLASVPVITGACMLASHIIISILYPQQYAVCVPYFWLANLTQVIYCITNIITIVLLRFYSVRYQVYVNVAYAVVFCVAAIPMTYVGGITGFCWGMLWACIARMAVALFVGYTCTWKNKERSGRTE